MQVTSVLKKVFILIICSLFVNANPVFSQVNWELTKDMNEIKVFTAKEGSSKFKTIKVEAIFPGTIQKLATVLMDVNNTKNWVYSTRVSYQVKKISPNEVIYYSETSLPWPVSNRDAAVLMKVNADYKSNTLYATVSQVLNAVPAKKGIVRISYFNAVWNVKSDGKDKLIIDYQLRLDPGGSVPAGVINMFITKGPYETFKNLAELLK